MSIPKNEYNNDVLIALIDKVEDEVLNSNIEDNEIININEDDITS